MNLRRAAVRVLRPTLIIGGIVGLAYLAGGPDFFTPRSLLGFVLVTIVIGLSILFFLGGIQADEHRHVNAITRMRSGFAGSHHSANAHAHRQPPMPFYVNHSMLPPGYNTRADTPEKVINFTRRVFRSRDATHNRDQ